MALTPDDFGFGQLFWEMRDAVVVGDVATGRIVLWNPAAEDLFAIPWEAAIGRPIETLMPATLRTQHSAGLARFRETGHGALIDTGRPVELPALRGTGEPITIELRLSPITTSRVPGRFVLAIIRDVTVRKQAEQDRLHLAHEQAEVMQARLAAIVEAAADGILSVDRDGTILSWNRGAETLYGYAADEALGQSVVILRPPEADDDITQSIARVWQGENLAEEETIRLTKDGRRILVSLTLFPIRNAHGEIVAISSISRDLTALRQTQDALRLRDRALDATRNGIVITDPSLPDNPIVDVNPAFTTLTGYARSEVVGQNCRFLQGPGTDPAVVARLRAAIAAGVDSAETLLNYRKDGTPFWNDLSIAAVRDATGVVTHFIGVISDATDRTRYERELQDALEAAQAGVRAKSLFLAMMSHELRTPLQAVLGYAHFLLQSPSGSLTPEQRDDVNAIQSSAGRMVTLIEQLLDLTRMEAGRLELAIEPVELATILDQVAQDIVPTVAEKALSFAMELPADVPQLQGDPTRLRQILLNLVGNAVKFTDAGSVTLQVSVTATEVVIGVRDTGIGIAPEALPFIFEEFRQVDSRLSRRYGGAGLGLAISQRLAEQMHGAITVDSEPGVGSVFTLRLPLAKPVAQ